MKKELKDRQNKVNWNCRFHPSEVWHEVGCQHKDWTAEDLLEALISKKEFEESNLHLKK